MNSLAINYDLFPIQVKDQLIKGLRNTTLQADILTKTATLDTLEGVIKYAEAYETALLDQALNASAEEIAAR